MFKYSLTERFPVPYIEVKVINPALNVSSFHRGKIDTGADLTVIPDFITDELTLQPRGTAEITDFRREVIRTVPFFYVNVELAGYSFEHAKVIEAVRPDILLGRNILNKVKLVLNGKDLEFEIMDP